MNTDQAIAIVQEKLGFRSDLPQQILAKFNEAILLRETGRTLPPFLILEDEELTLVAGQNWIDLPTGFIRMVDDDNPRITMSNPSGVSYLKQGAWDDILRARAGQSEGNVSMFAIRKNKIWFSLTPTENATAYWSYYTHDTPLTTTSDETNLWLTNCPYLIIGKAGHSMGQNLKSDQDTMQYFANMAIEWDNALMAQIVEWETHGPVVMGSAN